MGEAQVRQVNKFFAISARTDSDDQGMIDRMVMRASAVPAGNCRPLAVDADLSTCFSPDPRLGEERLLKVRKQRSPNAYGRRNPQSDLH